MRRRLLGLTLALVVLPTVLPTAAWAADPSAPPRVVDLEARSVGLQARVVDLHPKPQVGGLAIDADVLFAFGSFTLSSTADAVLRDVKTRVNAAKGKTVTITGHTDSVGSDAANLLLSRRRAQAVATRLQVAGVRFVVVGKGETSPVAPNKIGDQDNPAGRRLIRRVTVVVTS